MSSYFCINNCFNRFKVRWCYSVSISSVSMSIYGASMNAFGPGVSIVGAGVNVFVDSVLILN